MRERLRQFGGELRIDSHGGGTGVFVTIPLIQPNGSTEESGMEPIQAAIS